MIFALSLILVGCTSGEKAPEQGDNVSQDTPAQAGKDAPAQAGENQNEQAVAEDQFEQMYFRVDEGQGSVEVGVFWAAPEYFEAVGNEQSVDQLDLENNIVFEVSMTTHSGDLRDYSMLEKAELEVDGKILKPTKWELSSKDSHHPVGVLAFPAKDENGDGVIRTDSTIKLNMKDLRDVPKRMFVWELPMK